ncbi:galactosyltransferase-related protein [Burkholderia oklahomensis]|uniref:Glycosyl transferase 2 family protein n=1 Tax=Burkholderia oklahomensis TaxID=342113 RepID=A0AAI8B9T6_9BURK|nr:galactosyltransferase-related protein [Burkholderia oklahomensis]AIO68321.1 glycosyl transferase 2 family protein [Burkholderia oklahomensis]AOI41977.1 glycosyl transferase family 2 [Burkholderia oklahomensis EO147]KUY61385.1 glycosyl transferase family 2 [Burkholderia oklahomensis EO147]QPS36719.1 glycosyltransferase [Burkholderia oklahomensis]
MLSIIVTWRNRNELAGALPGLVETAGRLNGEIVIVNFGGDADSLARQLEGHEHAVHVAELREQRYFHKTKAQNLGAHVARHDILFFCDCDIIVDPDVIASLVRKLDATPGTFATLKGVRETEQNSRQAKNVVCFGYRLDVKIRNGRALTIVDNEEDAQDGTRQAPGLLLVRKRDFLSVNGYNGRLHGWGWEDQDMISRLTLGAGLVRHVDGHALHISHDDHARVSQYPMANRWESRDKMFRQALAYYDDDDFLGTYAEDVEHFAADMGVACS